MQPMERASTASRTNDKGGVPMCLVREQGIGWDDEHLGIAKKSKQVERKRE